MEQDSFRAVTPDGRTVVEVIFSSPTNEAVLFHCRVVLDGNTEHPLEELKTEDEDKCLRWMRKQMEEAMRRTAHG